MPTMHTTTSSTVLVLPFAVVRDVLDSYLAMLNVRRQGATPRKMLVFVGGLLGSAPVFS